MGMGEASATMAAKFFGQSARQRGFDKQRLALDWVYRWGWARPGTIEKVGGASRSGLAARLVRNGLLEETKTFCGGAHEGVPAKIMRLTQAGLEEVERTREVLLPYDFGAGRSWIDGLRKFQKAQTATLGALNAGRITGFQVEKEMAPMSFSGVKQPDVAWVVDNALVGIVVELSAKWDRNLDAFVRGCVNMLLPADGQPAHFGSIAVVSDSDVILKRYSRAFQPGELYKVWKKDARGYWGVADTRAIPSDIRGKMLWIKYGT